MSDTSNSAGTPNSGIGVPAAQASGGGTFFGGGGTASAPTVTGSGNPLISQDQSAFSQYVLGQTGSDPVTIGNLPGVPSQTTTIGGAINDFMSMTPSQLNQIEMQLWDAGFYITGDGAPMSAQDVQWGVPGDPASWTALTRALGVAASSGVSLMALLQQRTSQGTAQSQMFPSAVTGGGQTYTIDLSNPETVKYVADTVFQQAVGHNATAADVAEITANLRGQETAQGLAREQGQEQQSKAQYQAGVNQANSAYQAATNPNPNGQIPSGSYTNPSEWSTALLAYMNLPVTTSSVAAIAGWVEQTGRWGDGSFNPLGTSRPESGSQTTSSGAQQFTSWAQGLQATRSMLTNSKYASLIQALNTGQAATAFASDQATKQALQVWSGGNVSSVKPSAKITQQAAQAAAAYQQQQAQTAQQNQPAPTVREIPPNMLRSVPRAQQPQPQQPPPPTVPQSGTAGMATVNPTDLQQGQQATNPADTYINPVTTFDVDPASEQAAAWQQATTGANRGGYLGNLYDQFYQQLLAATKNAPAPAG